MSNSVNLVPFQKGFDSRRQNGRKPGSKNISTIIQELLDSDISEISNEKIKSLIEQQNAKTAKKAILSVAIIKALNGDLKTTQWLFSYLDDGNEEKSGFFDSNEIKVVIIDPKQRENTEVQKS